MDMRLNGTLLGIGAHPDDIELMCGGLIDRTVAAGGEAFAVVISDGCENGEVTLRQKEAQNAARMLGIKELHLCGIKDGNIHHSIEMVKLIDRYIHDIQPDLIITHCDQDTHQDHKNVCNITLSATRRCPNMVLLGETPSSFLSDNLVYVDISKSMGRKITALKEFSSQIQSGPLDLKSVRMLAAFRGQKVGTRYAEAFKNWRIIF